MNHNHQYRHNQKKTLKNNKKMMKVLLNKKQMSFHNQN